MVMRYLGGVNSPSYNPLAANVTTGTTVIQDGGVYTVASAAQANGLTQWVDDPYFSSTVTLLQADNFANGSQNNTFQDLSQNNFTVTRVGNATQGSFNPLAIPNGYWSNLFGGTTAYLSTPSTSAFSFGTGNFSFEVFGYALNWPAIWRFITTPTPFAVNGDTTSGLVKLDLGSGGVSTGIVLPLNTWFHFVVTRQSGTVRIFLDGILRYTVSNATNFSATGVTSIGGIASFSQAWSGYLSNMRVVNGGVPTLYQTSSTTLNTLVFTPPTTPLLTTSQGAPGTNTFLTCQSNRFVDNGTSALAITPVNNPTTVSSSPFRVGSPGQYSAIRWGGSMSFNGTTQYLSLADNNAWDFGSGNFTVEGWFFTSVSASYGCMVGQISSTAQAITSSWGLYPSTTSGVPNLIFSLQGVGVYTVAASSVATPLNVWTHLAAVRNGATITLYLNGVSVGTSNVSTTALVQSAATLAVGRAGDYNGDYFNGLASNIRIIKGTALYTSNFTPSTEPLTAITNTQLLTCQGSAVDSSTNNFSITNVNAVTASTSGPFTIPGSTGSAYFDGTGDYLTLTGSANLAFGTGDFTIECWFYLTALPVSPRGAFIYDSRPSADGAYPCIFVAPTTNVLTYYVSTAARITGTTALTIGQWNYVVVSRVSGTTRMFLNGAQQGSNYTDATNYLNSASRPVIANNGLNLDGALNGYISNLRAIKGSGVTTAPIPTTPLTAITNTQLLLNGTNAGIVDSSARSVNETVGNAQVSTAVKKYGSGSMYFDGTGDWLLVPNSVDLNFGTGDFTVECWVNISSTSAIRHLIGKGTSTTGWAIYFNTTPALFVFEYGGAIAYTSNSSLNAGQWYHIAVVRSGLGNNNFRMYLNGFMIFESTITTDLTTTSNMYVGASRTSANPMLGYVDDLRISKFARYTGQFIPPAVAMQKQG
jgi:hypothetical protein